MNRFQILIIICFQVLSSARAQDIEKEYASVKQSLKSEPISVSGTAGFSSSYYVVNGISPRRDPFLSVFSANLQITLLNKITVPFSMLISTKEKTYSNGLEKYNRAFNQFGISPTYKGLTAHIGHRSLHFSDYSLSGVLLLGGGLEFKPAKSLLSGMAAYGRLIKAVPADLQASILERPTYERWAKAAKLRLGDSKHLLELLVMSIQDRPYSIPADLRNSATPAENTVISIATRQTLLENLTLDADYSISLFTPNLFFPVSKTVRYSYRNQLTSERAGTRTSEALNTNLNYTGKGWQTGIKFKRIAPDYLSLGAPYICNDVDERSLNAGAQVFHNKLQIQSAIGLQRNNLDQAQVSTNKRVIGSLNVSFQLKPSWSIQGTYSTFSSNSMAVRNLLNDSLYYWQLSKSAGGNSSYGFGNNNYKGQVQLQALFQESSSSSQINKISTYQSGLQLSLTKYVLDFSTNALLNTMSAPGGIVSAGLGGSAQVQKGFYKNKLKVNINASLLKQFQSKLALSNTLLLGTALNARLSKVLSLRFDYSLQQRNALRQSVENYREHRFNFSCQIALSQKIRHVRTKK